MTCGAFCGSPPPSPKNSHEIVPPLQQPVLLLVQTFLFFFNLSIAAKRLGKWEEPFFLFYPFFVKSDRFFSMKFSLIDRESSFFFCWFCFNSGRPTEITARHPRFRTLPIERRWTNRRRWSHWHHPGLSWPHIGRLPPPRGMGWAPTNRHTAAAVAIDTAAASG